MAGNIYLFLDGIPGESLATAFENWIDIASFSVGNAMEVDQEARTGSGGGTSGAADPEDFSFDKKMDVATPVLLTCCATGAIIPRGRLVQCNIVNELRVPVSDYAIGDSIITSVSLSGSGGAIPDESLTLAYGSIIWQYYLYSHSNPSNEIAVSSRQWSLLKSNPTIADPNCQDALTIDGRTGGSYDEHAGSVSFTAGTAYDPS
ncbi:MAG: type VI secretion system secreted protein Hcp [Lentimonas sp.]|jgi:type VI secretion system secreted protein Hcp